MDCFGTYFTHVQSCDVPRVQSATEWTASVQLHTRNGLLWYILHTCLKLWCNPCSKCYGMDCFGTYFTHVQSCDVTRVQICDVTRWISCFFLDFQLWNHRFPIAKRQFSSWSHGPATRNTCASTSGLFKSTTNTTFQVPELRIQKKRNVVHARAPYQPATLFLCCGHNINFKWSSDW